MTLWQQGSSVTLPSIFVEFLGFEFSQMAIRKV
jgi:hypothetical protein